MRNLLLFLPLICLSAKPRSGGANAKKDDSSKFHLSLWENGASTSRIRLLSVSTSMGSTEAASPCLRNSFILYLSFRVWLTFIKGHHIWESHALQNDWTHDSPSSRSFCGTSNLSSKRFRFSASILPLTVSRFSSIDLNQITKARSTSGLVTTRGRFDDRAEGCYGSTWTMQSLSRSGSKSLDAQYRRYCGSMWQRRSQG